MTGKPGSQKIIRYAFLPLLPLFFVLHGFNEHFPVVPVSDCFLLAAQYLSVTLVLVVLFYLILRSLDKACLFTFFLLLVFLFFGAIHDFLKTVVAGTFIAKYSFLLPALLVIVILSFFWMRRTQVVSRKLIKYLDVLLIVLILVEFAQLAMHRSPSGSKLDIRLSKCDSCKKPDVYVIVADGYAGSKELEQVFHFDNSVFENQLRKKGFFIADSSVSNYNYTPFSMASLFTMNYLDGLEGKNKSDNDRRICYTAINSNPVFDFFKNNGYSIQNFSVFRVNDEAPLYSNSFHKSGKDLVTQHTLWSRIERDILYNFALRYHITSQIEKASYQERDLNQNLIEKTAEEAKNKTSQPRFVYTHLELPHYPYYFDKNGKPYPLNSLLNDTTQYNRDRYIQYLQYSNGKLLELVDHILAASTQPPVILLMSDHGFREFKNEAAVDHKYHFMNLNAILLPNKNYSGFYKGISIVNQFRVVLNSGFGQKLPLLKDSCSFLTE